MTRWHGYVGMENLALNNAQRSLLVQELQALGPTNETQPARINHWRIRNDNDAAIFEANFLESNLTVAKVKGWLADIFSVDAADVGHGTQVTQYGPMVTYNYPDPGTDYIRILAFAGVGSTWEESRQKAVLYLRNNAAAWG